MAGNIYLNLLDSENSDDSENENVRRHRRRRRVFRARINFGLDLCAFQEKFRIYSAAAEYVLRLIGVELSHATFRNHALSPQMQFLAALHFVGNGSQYHGIADMHGLSKASVCRVVHKVATVIIRNLFLQHVRWPNVNAETIPLKFMEIARFPRVAGIVDDSLIPIDAPEDNEEAYIDRKGSHSLNAMVVCGPKLQFYFASANWPGSVHDARVMRNSTLYEQWERRGKSVKNYLVILLL